MTVVQKTHYYPSGLCFSLRPCYKNVVPFSCIFVVHPWSDLYTLQAPGITLKGILDSGNTEYRRQLSRYFSYRTSGLMVRPVGYVPFGFEAVCLRRWGGCS